VPLSLLALLVILLLFWYWGRRPHQLHQSTAPPASPTQPGSTPNIRSAGSETAIHAHNLLLRKGPNFHVYVRWLAGRLARTHRDVNPSFDHPDSFDLDIQSGVIRVNIGDIGYYLNSSIANSPLKNVSLLADGKNLKLTAVVHKIIPLPVQVIASVAVAPDDRIRVHIDKIDVLKLPVKGLLGLLHISAADLVKTNVDGVQIEGNDLLLDTHKLLPPPHIRGHLTQLSVDSPDIQAVYGDAEEKVEDVELWRNFFSLDGGTIDFGSLSMHPVKIIMIDISSNPWFDLDLVNYRQQFANGYTRMTSDSGLQIFIPDLRDIHSKPASQDDSIQWFKIATSLHHRKLLLPSGCTNSRDQSPRSHRIKFAVHQPAVRSKPYASRTSLTTSNRGFQGIWCIL
jgi:hypothetical protein